MTAPRPWAYSAFPVTVSARRMLSPRFLRLTLAGGSLEHFAPWGVDQRIKLVLPLPGGGLADFGLLDEPTPHPSHWYTRWKGLPEGERNVLRTYTPAAVRPDAREIDVDVFLHSPEGPASSWARAARVGDELVVTGPDARNGWTGYGIHWTPPDTGPVLLVGDETALPAVRNIIGSLPPDASGVAIVEIGDPADDGALGGAGLPSGVELRIVRRGETASAVRAHASADLGAAWLAGESSVVTSCRRLIRETGLPRERLSFLGYWREGGPLVD
ncbi:siderophore-interacting protein [Cnuibacter physcomitrellae]|uniref:NADPH-dependent ferric siderophore reductase n=1 Tax=Cnuibacter physcomitrellae TaxID=1619308 RepID=A0A1X9LFC6_9MICO|nr:siderophore-interacting protein [Cnuibacter physcomitrellae]ARJ03843.1 NADPH-dependent ferric siderophore reductase [Cnuibacter physcomitrellae]GGI39632.1 siderophore-interacting protein [Cnuibacter physcomitrellae]